MKVLSIGGGAREHAVVRAFHRAGAEVYSVMKNRNPGIAELSREVCLCTETDIKTVLEFAARVSADLAFIGPEAPLAVGLSDALEEKGIPVASPSQAAARIETSKEFARELMKKHDIPGRVDFRVFHSPEGIKEYLESLKYEYVIKPIGLTGGKGVKVMGDHFSNTDEAMAYIDEIFSSGIGGGAGLIIEEKAVGEEFTIQAFTDGVHVMPTPAVQDNKRAYEGDKGPNTGGMGSYSRADGLLPFLKKEDYDAAVEIIRKTVKALKNEGNTYKGVLYGQFILTADGVKVIEYNARFGDPEAMNVLSTLKTSMVEIAEGIVNGSLPEKGEFEPVATVCKYVVPEGYGVKSLSGEPLLIDEKGIEKTGAEIFYASVNVDISDSESAARKVYTTSSRSLGILAKSGKRGNEGIYDAERIVENAMKNISGRFFSRHDIGTKDYIENKMRRMEEIGVNRIS